jgi:hypothetical protein
MSVLAKETASPFLRGSYCSSSCEAQFNCQATIYGFASLTKRRAVRQDDVRHELVFERSDLCFDRFELRLDRERECAPALTARLFHAAYACSGERLVYRARLTQDSLACRRQGQDEPNGPILMLEFD